ncbi:MAG TPA: VWA domain-containing protein [Thermoanaerobaculia bacterium]|nr:VWA domain-containing protein [Thermoanaerobaculia bacterium]
MTRRLFPPAAAACAAFFALCLAAAAQQKPAAEAPPVFGEEVDVRVVNLEVVVTDRQGNRVPDLKPGDFVLRVDGKDVPIDYFSEVREGRSVAAPAVEGQAEPEAGEVQSVAPAGAVGTYYLVFVDDYFTIANQRNVVLAAFKADLARLGPEDRMAIVAYDGGRLAMISNWSSSRSDLERAFDQAMARSSHGLERLVERRSLRNDEGFAGTRAADGRVLDLAVTNIGLNDRERAYGTTLYRQVQGAIGAAVSAMRGFAAPQGRKVMLLLSGGWPFSIASFIRGGEAVPLSQDLADGDRSFRELTSTANLLGYTVYPVDVPGSQTLAADAEASEPARSGFGNIPEQEVEGTLYFLARETGGKPMLNSNRTSALANAGADTRSYYWLGFSPSWQRNDQRHAVKVEVRRPGLEVRSRASFLDLSRKAEVSMKLESALLIGSFPGALPMEMKLGTPVRSKRGRFEVPVTLALPVDVMTVVPVDGKYAAQLELRFAASDADGNGSEIPVLPLNLTSAKPPTPGRFVRYETKFTLQGKANHVVVAVYDPLSGKIATAESDLVAP